MEIQEFHYFVIILTVEHEVTVSRQKAYSNLQIKRGDWATVTQDNETEKAS